MDKPLQQIVVVGVTLAAGTAVADSMESFQLYGPFVQAGLVFIAWVVGAGVIWGSVKQQISTAEQERERVETLVLNLTKSLQNARERLASVEATVRRAKP